MSWLTDIWERITGVAALREEIAENLREELAAVANALRRQSAEAASLRRQINRLDQSVLSKHPAFACVESRIAGHDRAIAQIIAHHDFTLAVHREALERLGQNFDRAAVRVQARPEFRGAFVPPTPVLVPPKVEKVKA